MVCEFFRPEQNQKRCQKVSKSDIEKVATPVDPANNNMKRIKNQKKNNANRETSTQFVVRTRHRRGSLKRVGEYQHTIMDCYVISAVSRLGIRRAFHFVSSLLLFSAAAAASFSGSLGLLSPRFSSPPDPLLGSLNAALDSSSSRSHTFCLPPFYPCTRRP